MRSFFLLFYLLINLGFANAQVSTLDAFLKKGKKEQKVFAIIVGISDYKDPELNDLLFADRDAEIFAEYLMSPSGGSVPQQQIKLLKGSDATVANVYDALSWIKKQVSKGDKFYFYFAGHGDLENSLYQLGFLLTYDTPYQNYINNAIRIEDLNILANTLSVNQEVNTILITDACHSGTLAGSDNRGTSLVGENLAKVQSKEVRFSSCEPSQKSQENTIWGGGRGVFSFYLVNGMKGLADSNKDGKVNLQEIESYLGNNVSRDVMNLKLEEQNPVIAGKRSAIISNVLDYSIDSMLPSVTQTAGVNYSTRDASLNSSGNTDLITAYFKKCKDIKLESDFDFSKIISKPRNDVPEYVFYELQRLTNTMDTNVLNALKDSVVKTRFNTSFAAMIHDQVQEVINLYLKTDKVEIEKRQYYNSQSSNYDKYPIMIQAALNLLNEDHYLYHILEVKLYYFKGIAARLKIPISTNTDSLIAFALEQQLKALALEEHAAYIQNELGVLSTYVSGGIEQARSYYEKAIELSPSWAIPKSNMSALYAVQKQYQEGIKSAQTAIKLQPGFHQAYFNLGINYEGAGNWLFAEEQLQKSIKLNSKLYLTHEKLGHLYTHNMDYTLAESFFRKGELEQMNYPVMPSPYYNSTPIMSENVMSDNALDDDPKCINAIDTAEISQYNVMAYLVWCLDYVDRENITEQKRILTKLASIDPLNPLVFRYLAEIYYLEKNWLEAEINFKYADQNYLDKNAFLEYCGSIKPKQKIISECIEAKYKSKHYDRNELLFFFGELYESWGHFDEAQSYYRKIIKENPHDISGHSLLWNLKEKLGNYHDCEEAIRNFGILNKSQGESELFAFYKRRQSADTTDYTYYYKAANLMYKKCEGLPPGDELKPTEELTDPDFNSNNDNSPRASGVSMFREVFKLCKDTIILADAYSKTGDIYYWAGSNKKAALHYQNSIDLRPGDASIRHRIIDFYHEQFLFEQGLKHLEYLKANGQINYEKMLLLANYYIHQSKFDEADTLLTAIQSMQPIRKEKTDELKARSAFYSGKFEIALEYYLRKANNNETDPITDYTVSRIFALKNDNKNAIIWLKKSLDHGFKFGRVINNDTAWVQLKKSQEWEEINPKIVIE